MSTPADRYRPAWHYSARRHWINDPNGLIYADGEYHLFYQTNPFGDQWGHMSWGHAVSRDLLHWRELPLAIAEDERVSIYSGSVVIDHANSSGFGREGQAPWVAIYTGCLRRPEGGQAQELAWSLDRGLSWTQYAGNPVLDIGLKDFRDPKVFWHTATARWVMVVVRPDDHRVCFYASPDLRQWQHLSDFGPAGEVGGIWECPDLIEFPGEGWAPSRWVLKVDTFAGHPGGSGAQIFIGQFDGQRFVPDEPPGDTGRWVDHGCDFYAALSWGGLPAGRAPLWIAWMNNHGYAKHTPTSPWRGAMSLPRELSLLDTPTGTRLAQRPWPGLAALRGTPLTLGLEAGEGEHEIDLQGLDGRSLELRWELEPGITGPCSLLLRRGAGEHTLVGVDPGLGQVFIDRAASGQTVDAQRWAGRRAAPCELGTAPLCLRIFIDHCSVELFSADGAVALTELIFPADASRGLALRVSGTGGLSGRLTIWPLAGRLGGA